MQKTLYTFTATTDPGTYYLNNPINKDGTAILVPNYYKNIWAIDLHRGSYEALCQRLGPVDIYRDNDLDDQVEKTESIQSGFFGINLHRASRWSIVNKINKFSAGCQVIQDPAAFEIIMELARKHRDIYGNKFSYILLEEEQILGVNKV